MLNNYLKEKKDFDFHPSRVSQKLWIWVQHPCPRMILEEQAWQNKITNVPQPPPLESITTSTQSLLSFKRPDPSRCTSLPCALQPSSPNQSHIPYTWSHLTLKWRRVFSYVTSSLESELEMGLGPPNTHPAPPLTPSKLLFGPVLDSWAFIKRNETIEHLPACPLI